MSDNSVLKLSQPSTFSDPLTEVLRSGARSLLARAVEAEVAAFLDATPRRAPKKAADGWCATATCPNARS